MATSTIITDYIAEGTHAARPATPNIPTGASSIYYETDTTNTFAWSGSAWVQINGAGIPTTPTIVQTGSNSGASITGVTLSAAPTNGNLLVSFSTNGSSGVIGTGWTSIAVNNSVDFGTVAWKLAGAGESATQNPMNAAGSGVCSIFELNNAGLGFGAITFVNAASGTISVTSTRAGGLLIGAIMNNSTTALPTAITGASLDSSSAGASKATQAYHKTPSAGVNSVAWTFAASGRVYPSAVIVY